MGLSVLERHKDLADLQTLKSEDTPYYKKYKGAIIENTNNGP